MSDQKTFKDWLPIDGQQYKTPFGTYTAHLIGDVKEDFPDHNLCYSFHLVCPNAQDYKMTVWAYWEHFLQEARRQKILGDIATSIKNADQKDIEIDFRKADLFL